MTVACPECASDVELGADVRQNEVLECRECRSELEVVTVSPPVLALAPEVEEDWGE